MCWKFERYGFTKQTFENKENKRKYIVAVKLRSDSLTCRTKSVT